jgi:hypothetical protein
MHLSTPDDGEATMAIMAEKLPWATLPWRRPDPRDGYEAWADSVVATATHFIIITVNRHGFAKATVSTFDEVLAFITASKTPESILAYAINDAGQQVCISPQLEHFQQVWEAWNRGSGRA